MKEYNSFDEINNDLKRLKLERQIALEELKLTQNQVKHDLAPLNWLDTVLKVFYKYGFSIVLNRLFKRF